MSWLLVAFIPGLLMLATFGLSRVEAALDGDAVSPQDVVAVLERAKADCAKPAARVVELPPTEFARAGQTKYVIAESPPNLPTRVLIHHRANPEFQPTGHAFRV